MRFDFNIYRPLHASEFSSHYCKKVICVDGFSISIQASSIHHCHPRKDNQEVYTKVELGIPSIPLPPEFDLYCEDLDKPTEAVYGYVPVEMVNDLINSHGGLYHVRLFG